MNEKSPDMYTFASLFEQYDAAVHQGWQNNELWLQNLTGKKKDFCEWLQKNGGVRGALSIRTIVAYVEIVSACSGYVQSVMKLDLDFYKMDDAAILAKLAVQMYAHPYFNYFSAFLQIQPRTAVNRYLYFCRYR